MSGPHRVRVAAFCTSFAIVLGSALTACSSPAPDPFAGRTIMQSRDNPAIAAVAQYRRDGDDGAAALVSRIADEPTATWLLPEKYPTDEVTAVVTSLATAAAQHHGIAVFVVYGISDRDCGAQSSGGLEPADYAVWVQAIARGLKGGSAALIVEPDALAQAGKCASIAARTNEIGSAVRTLAATGAAVYIDAGNSDWMPAATMATRLNAADIAAARGFSTNVSNYQSLAKERAYANHVASLVGTTHYVIDTSRNGQGGGSEWCNPKNPGIGADPAATPGGGAEDALLWIKQPGESDGTCNGGPAAGVWWPAMALDLARNAAG